MVANLSAKALGQRIRQLRTQKAMTQQDLAGEDYSKSYISAIEQGKTRPSLEALQRMASRLEVPAGVLLDPNAPGFAPTDLEAMPRRVRRRRGVQGAVDKQIVDLEQADLQLLEAELLIQTGHAAQAREMLSEMLPNKNNGNLASHLMEPAQLQKAYQLAAEASLRLEYPTEAMGYLQSGMQYATRLGNREVLERMKNLMGLAYYQANQPLSALELHRGCLEAIEAGIIRDPNFKLIVSRNIANDYWALHDDERADSTYEAVAKSFKELMGYGKQAEAFWGLASSFEESSKYAQAKFYANKALDVYEAMNNVLLVAQMENNLGHIRLRKGDLDGAEKCFKRSLELCESLQMDCDSVLAMNSLARISLERGDLQAAMERAEEAVTLGRSALKDAQASDEPRANGSIGRHSRYIQGIMDARRALAKALAISGEVYTASGDAKSADKTFTEAIEITEADGAGTHVGEIYQRYAHSLASRGQHEKASKYFEKALAKRKT